MHFLFEVTLVLYLLKLAAGQEFLRAFFTLNLHGEHSGFAVYASVSTMPSRPILSMFGEPPLGLPNIPRSPQPI